MLTHLRKHFFFYIVTLLIVISVVASYTRFLVDYDYSVRYEGDCDPYEQSCYVYCEDENCSDPFYYSWITADAANIVNNCDDDVTLCDYAYDCVESNECKIEYCSTGTDECDTLSSSDAVY